MSRLRFYFVPALLLLPLIFVGGRLLLTPVVRDLSEEEAETIPDNWTMSGPPMIIDYGWPWIFTERSDWLGEESDYATFFLWWLTGDLIILSASIAIAGWLLIWHRRSRGGWLRLSLRELLAFVTLCACGLGWWTHHLHLSNREGQIENGILKRHGVMCAGDYYGADFLSRFTETSTLTDFFHVVELDFPFGIYQLAFPVLESHDEVQTVFGELPYLRRLRFPSNYIEQLLNFPIRPKAAEFGSNGLPTAQNVAAATPDPPWLETIDLSALSNIEEIEFYDGSGQSGFEDNDILIVLARLPRLRSLTIDGGFITSRGIDRVARRGMLEQLEIGYTNVGDDDAARLSQLTRLRCLNLSGTKISDAALEHVAQIRSLKVLKIRDCAVTDRGILQLLKLPNLRWLTLTKSPGISDESIERLQQRIPSVNMEDSR